MPAPTTKIVPSSTRNTLRRDHSMMRFSMSVPFLPWGACRRALHRLYRSGRDAGNEELARALLCDIDLDALAGLDALEQRLVLDLEAHGHRGPVEAGDRAMFDVDAAGLRVYRAHRALALVHLAGRGSRALRCGRFLLGAAEGSQRRLEIAFGIDQEIGGDHHVFPGLDPVEHLDVTIGMHPELDQARFEQSLPALHQHCLPR